MSTFGAMRGSLRLLMTTVIAMAFIAAIAPRTWFHDCDQAHVSHHHPDQAAITGDLDCEVCSVVVTVFDEFQWAPALPAPTVVSRPYVPPAPCSVSAPALTAFSRGPPLS